MNRNTNAHFAELPSADIPRSTFDRSFSHKLSGNTGDVIPITPMMDNLYCDIYWFFVPYRLVCDHWPNFMGENIESAFLY